jgi:hypothetical protein
MRQLEGQDLRRLARDAFDADGQRAFEAHGCCLPA